MVLAAGIGKRMRPLTATTPKPLIEVAGKALVDHGLDRLAKAGMTTAVVDVLSRRPRRGPRAAAQRAGDRRLRRTRRAPGDRQDIQRALPLLGSDPFYVYNADSFWIEGVADNFLLLADFWDDATMDVLLLLSQTVTAVGYDGPGDFVMDALGRLERRFERRIAPFVYAGAAIIHPRAFDGVAAGRFSVNRQFDAAIAAGRLYGVHMDGIWLHGHARGDRRGRGRHQAQRRLSEGRGSDACRPQPAPASSPSPRRGRSCRRWSTRCSTAGSSPGFRPGGDPLALADVTVLVPTRRAARALREAFLAALGGRAAILPRIEPLGDIDEDALLLGESDGAPRPRSRPRGRRLRAPARDDPARRRLVGGLSQAACRTPSPVWRRPCRPRRRKPCISPGRC